VTENLLLSRAGLGRLNRRAGREMVARAAARLGVRIDPDARVERLSVGEQQRVEIVKALSRDCRVLILDEPTAVLVPQDVDALFDSIRLLTGHGMGVLFISHKLGEVTRISDRVSVLRRGRIVDTVPTAASSPAGLAELMVGRPTVGVRRADRAPVTVEEAAARPVPAEGPPAAAPSAVPSGMQRPEHGAAAPPVTGLPGEGRSAAVLSLRGVRLAGRGKDVLAGIDLAVMPGEIVVLAGDCGNCQTELVQLLCGLVRPTAGSVWVNGVDVTGADPERVIAAGLGRITEDRHACVIGTLSVAQNLVLEDLPRFRRGLLLDRKAIRAHAQRLIDQFSIRATPDDPIGALSGGNMQKVLLARALDRDPVALVASQPTRGLDVGATEFVHGQLLARRAAGAGVLLVSEDLEELLALSDRIAVIYEGSLVGELPAEQATPERLGLLMAGQPGAAA
jgi:simple sugar transport system ATP-binding protein